jgi:hypothetical protein
MSKPTVKVGKHLTVTTYPDGRVDMKWDWDALAEEIRIAITPAPIPKKKKSKKKVD